jgi:hypothetical protein
MGSPLQIPAAEPANLSTAVNQLPGGQTAEKWKRSALRVALERMKSCEDAGATEEAALLAKEIAEALAQPAAAMATPASDPGNISALFPVKAIEGNPYLARLLAGANDELEKPDPAWPKSTQTVNVFDGLSGQRGSRDTAESMQAWLWLLVNPASPLKHDPEVLERFLRRALAYSDAMDLHGVGKEIEATVSSRIDSGPKAGQGLFDDFAIGPAAAALREFATLYPNLLLPSQKAQLDRAMRNGGHLMFGKAKDRPGKYANIDLALAYELLNFGLYLKNQEYLDKAKFLLDRQEANIYPDGGIAYLGSQNESNNYHDSCTRDLARYYEISRDDKCLELLKRTEWFGPVTSGRLAEFWTVPSWKQTWNNGRYAVAGGEPVASLTGNPYLRFMCDWNLPDPAKPQTYLKSWGGARLGVAWWRDDVKPRPLPDNYTVVDRNICGPRAWYGRFNYAAQLRPIPNTEPGLFTLMGCQITEEDFSLHKAINGIFPRVRVKPDARTKNKEGIEEENKSAWAWLTSGLKSAAAYGRQASAVGGAYRLHAFGSSTKGPDSQWIGQQVWIGLPDCIIGLLVVRPEQDGATAWEVNGVVRLTSGGTALGSLKKVEQLDNKTFQYGDFVIKLHDHNFATVKTEEVPFRLPKAPLTDIVLVDEVSSNAGGNQAHAYPASSVYSYITEIRPSWAKGEADVKALEAPAGVLALQVDLNGKRYAFWFNSMEVSVQINPKLVALAGVNTSLRDSSAPDAKPITSLPESYNVEAGQGLFLISSPDANDHLPGWANFQDMLAAEKKPAP